MNGNYNYSIRALDASNALAFHAEQFAENDWRYTSTGMSGMAIGDRRSVISALAHMVGTGQVTMVESQTDRLGLYIDAAGNTWLRDRYLSSADWLQAIIPVSVPDSPPVPM